MDLYWKILSFQEQQSGLPIQITGLILEKEKFGRERLTAHRQQSSEEQQLPKMLLASTHASTFRYILGCQA